jgi:hypothetical protein
MPSIKLRRNVAEFPEKNLNFNYLSLFIPALKGEAFIYVTLRELGEPFVIIDVRALYFESGFKILAESILAEEFIRKLKEYKGLFEKLGDKLVELISRIESISAGPLEIKVKKSRKPRLAVMLNEINDWCDKNGRIFIVAIDEAQYLRFFNKRFDLLLSWSIDNLKIYVCLKKVKTRI